MSSKAARARIALGALVLFLFASCGLRAQDARPTLSGTITSASGAALPDATVSVKNAAGAVVAEARSDAAGHYSVPNLAAGDYSVSVSANGYATEMKTVSIAAGAAGAAGAGPTVDIVLTLSGSLSVGDLGFSSSQTQGSSQAQARLDKRSRMLRIHQRLGLLDTIPLAATLATSFGAGGRSTSSSARWTHLALGSATGDLYFTSAYFAIFAPKIPGTQVKGPIRLHKALMWIHGPGMILTPILGAMAFDEKAKGERVHGIASAHGPVAIITASAYAAAILSLTFKW
jgi:hypothetical protein